MYREGRPDLHVRPGQTVRGLRRSPVTLRVGLTSLSATGGPDLHPLMSGCDGEYGRLGFDT